MTNPYRAMCAELLKALESWSPGGGGPLEDADEIAEAHLIDRARALLDRLEQEVPTVMEILELHSWLEDEWRANNDGEDLPTLDFARAVLARWGHPTPQPVAAGEVAASLIELKSTVMTLGQMKMYVAAQRVGRAADLLQRQHPQPVPVSERPWEREGWCDAEGRCWAWHPFDPESDEVGDYWTRIPRHWIDDIGIWSHCLPANALSTPEATNA